MSAHASRSEPATVILRAIRRTASLLEALARERSLTRINERDHLAPVFAHALDLEASQVGARAARPGERVVGDLADWPRLGNADAFLTPPPTFIELKVAGRADALSACSWDTLKLAHLIMAGRVAQGFLLAAAPTESWSRRIRGSEFFEHGRWHAEGVRGHYGDWFRHWETIDDPLPLRVPEMMSTRTVEPPVELTIGEGRWQLRLAEVRPLSAERFRWRPLI